MGPGGAKKSPRSLSTHEKPEKISARRSSEPESDGKKKKKKKKKEKSGEGKTKKKPKKNRGRGGLHVDFLKPDY